MRYPTRLRHGSVYLTRGTIFALTALLFLSARTISHAAGVVPGHVIVRLQTEDEIGGIENDYGSRSLDKVPGTSLFEIATPSGTNDLAFAIQLKLDSRVQDVELDLNLELPEMHGYPFHFPVDRTYLPGAFVDQGAYQQINAGKSHSAASIFDTLQNAVLPSGPIVAILDTGAALNHPAIRANLLSGWNAFNPGGPPRDIPDTINSPFAGHGTMIAALITRLAPNTRLLPVKILDADGNGSLMNVLKGLKYATDQGARVINMSFGTTQYSAILEEVLNDARDAGVLVIAAAGNSGKNTLSYPAAYNSVLSVASIGSKGHKSSFSNYGSKLSLDAPGEHIRSAYWNGGYATWSGTSFAAPFVSAQAALLLDSDNTLMADLMEERIRGTAHSLDILNPSYHGQLGAGLIDIQASLTTGAGN